MKDQQKEKVVKVTPSFLQAIHILALEILKQERPEIIIISMNAAELEKEITLKILREVDITAKFIVLMSGSINEDIVARICLSDSRVTLLRRTMDPPQLIRFILKTIKERKIEEVNTLVRYKGKTLIVDDEQKLAKLVATYLQKRGYDTDVAFSGEEALLKIKAIKPKVVILDILMPGMDGLLVLKRIKEIDDTIVVVITSGVQQDEQIFQQAINLGAATYLVKPYSLTQLESFIFASIIKHDKDHLLGSI